jgi:hypothetical protein
MFKTLSVLLLAIIIIAQPISAQGTKSVNYEPYINVGANLSSGQFGYGGEFGVYSDKVWYALGVSTAEDATGKSQWYGSAKAYYRISHVGFADAFAFGAVNVHLEKDKSISIEPGVAAVFNISNRLAPQVSLSFPVYENSTSLWKPLTVNLGLSLNVWLY